MIISQLIPFLNENKVNVKIHCATGNTDEGNSKLEAFFAFSKDKFKEWQEDQTRKNFEKDYILSLIYINKNEWLFAGIYQSLDVEQVTDENDKIRYKYRTQLLENGNEFIGKLVISFEKDFRASYLLLEKHIDNLLICEIKKTEYKFEPFPGFSNVNVAFDLLKEIINNNESSWQSALSSVKGIYLISDKSNGKLYVGSASGDMAFWQRWSDYIKDGHGGNKKLKEIIAKNGIKYCENFTFSILEICNINTVDEEILKKESFWKERLLTREYGYNDN
jgi:hypothetical protein